MSIVSAGDNSAVYYCPPHSVLGTWAQTIDTVIPTGGGIRVDTQGANCYMQYPFQGGSIAVLILENYDHGVFGCSIDGGASQWFNAMGTTLAWKMGCSITGLSAGQHTLRVTSPPMYGWWLTISNMTVGAVGTVAPSPGFISDFGSYQMQTSLLQAANSTNTTTASSPAGTTGPGTGGSTSASASSTKTDFSPGAIAAIGVLAGLLLLSWAALIYLGCRPRPKTTPEGGATGSNIRPTVEQRPLPGIPTPTPSSPRYGTVVYLCCN
ncbi:hypothetical protein FRB99_002870 [Tulasnella sp. 403]|nr:hypothetical protein FRB99_002870 [Tulasnella sp. 403]